jgi:hypothetical protein
MVAPVIGESSLGRQGRPADGVPGALAVRVSALAGAVFFVLIVIYSTLRSGAPSATDPGQTIVDYVTAHQDRLQLGAALWGFAMAAALVWLPGLVRAVRRAEGGTPALALVALAGGVLAAASTVTGALIQGTLATRIADLDPAGASVWWTMLLLSTGATLLGLVLLIGATAIVSLRIALFPRWFAVASVALALASAVGACTIGSSAAGIQVVAGLTILLDSGWILAVSVFLWRDPARALT